MSGNRIDSTFSRLREQKKAAFVAYLCAGDPSFEITLDLVLALEKAGADVVELGLPFSDPLADGIVNQLAAQRALEGGATTAGVLDLVREIRSHSQIPLVLFTYLNPVYTYGFERFHAEASAAGADGVLLLDLPPDEASINPELTGTHGLKQIRLVAPTTPPDRMRELGARAEGFIYYVSREGVTGARSDLASDIARMSPSSNPARTSRSASASAFPRRIRRRRWRGLRMASWSEVRSSRSSQPMGAAQIWLLGSRNLSNRLSKRPNLPKVSFPMSQQLSFTKMNGAGNDFVMVDNRDLSLP